MIKYTITMQDRYNSFFWKVTVQVPVTVPAPYLDHGNFFAFLQSKLFYKEKVYKFQWQIYYKMWMKIFLK